MDKVIVTALLVIAGVTAAALVVTTLTPIVGKSSRSVVESQKDMSLRIQTDITVIQVHSNTATTTKAWVKSVGNSNVDFIEQSDLFITSVDRSLFIPLTNLTKSLRNIDLDAISIFEEIILFFINELKETLVLIYSNDKGRFA